MANDFLLVSTSRPADETRTPALYQLTAEYIAIQQKLEEEGLDPQVIADTLEGLAFPLEQKAVACAHVFWNLDMQALAMGVAIERMQQRLQSVEKKSAAIHEYIRTNMIHAGIDKIETPEVKLQLKKLPASVEIFDEDMLPAIYFTLPEPPEPRPDKKQIADDLKAGTDVPGARLSREDFRLEIK